MIKSILMERVECPMIGLELEELSRVLPKETSSTTSNIYTRTR